jgi:hypothetical protein
MLCLAFCFLQMTSYDCFFSHNFSLESSPGYVYNFITRISLLREFDTYPGLISERQPAAVAQGLVAGSLANPRRMADQRPRGTWKGAQNPLSTLALSERSWEGIVNLLEKTEYIEEV